MATLRAWDRLVRLALVCAAVGAAVAPARARDAYAEVGSTPAVAPRSALARAAATARRARAAVAPVATVPRSPRSSRRARLVGRPGRSTPAFRRLYVVHRSLLR
jgi:hypothetical protein